MCSQKNLTVGENVLLLCPCCYVHWKSPLRISKALLKLLALQLPRLFWLPHLHENVYLPHSSCNATSAWPFFGVMHTVPGFLLVASHSHSHSNLSAGPAQTFVELCRESDRGIDPAKNNFFFPKSVFRQSSSWCSSLAVGWWKAGVLQDQEVGLGEQDAFLPPQCLVMLA